MDLHAHVSQLMAAIHGGDPRLFKVAGIASGGFGSSAFAYYLVGKPTSPLSRALAAYAHHLDRRFRTLFLTTRAESVIAAQGFALYAVVAASIALGDAQL